MAWAQWLATRPQSPVVMRAEAFADNYFARPFEDSGKYLGLRLTDLEDQHTVWAYVERDTATGLDLAQALAATPRLGITAELTFPPKTTDLQQGALIRRILPEG